MKEIQKVGDALNHERTWGKLLRDSSAMVLGFAFLYLAATLVNSDVSPELVAVAGPLSLFGWRVIRDVMGKDPENE